MKEESRRCLQMWQAECSRRELCEAHIRRKLALYGGGTLTKDETDEIIESLKKDKFLDDNRFAAAYIKDKTTFGGWGIRKVETELLKKGVAKSVAAKAIDNYLKVEQGAEKQLQLIEKTAAQKWNSITAEAKRRGDSDLHSDKLKAKLIRFLVGRGYDYQSAYSQAMKVGLSKEE